MLERMAKLRRLLAVCLLASVLASCSGGLFGSQELWVPPAATKPPTAVIPTPRPPTATAVVFQMQPTSTPVPTNTPAPTSTGASEELFTLIGPDHFPPDVNPLTGLFVDDPALLERRPVAVKVTNFPRSVRPQWGLSLADHVWEYYLEDLMTRFVGIFYGRNALRVGPVRSGRYFDEHLLRMYKSFLVFAYADDRVIDHWTETDFKNFLIIERPGNCPPMCRFGPKTSYNTLFVDLEALQTYIAERGTDNARQNLDGLAFRSLIPSGEPARRISIRYSIVSHHLWEFDGQTSRYLRSQETQDARLGEEIYEPLIDQLTGERVVADNVVVLWVPHEDALDSSDTEAYLLNFIGQGQGIVFRNGRAIRVLWERGSAASMVNLKMENGSIFLLKPGITWFEVVGETSTVEMPEEGSWLIRFAIP